MKKRLILVSLAVFLFATFVAIPQHQASAAAPLIRIAGGSFAKKALKALGEKAGMRYASKKQLDNQIDFINYRSSQGDQVYQQFVRDLEAAEATAKPSSKPGWKKYVLDPILWGTGLDILLAGYNAFKDAATVQAPIIVADPSSLSNTGFTCHYGIGYWSIYQTSNGARFEGYGRPGTFACSISSVSASSENPGYVDVVATYRFKNNEGNNESLTLSSAFFVGYGMDWDAEIGYMPRTFVPTLDDLPEYQAVPAPWPDEPIEIELPDEWIGDNDDDFIDPWNPPLDTGDPAEPPPDDKPEGSSWWEWLLKPLIALIEGISKVISSIVDLIGDIIEAITGLAEKIIDALVAVLIPSDNYFRNYFSGVKGIWDTKIPIIGQLQDFFDSVGNAAAGEEVPEFIVTMPEKFGAGEYNIIDFKYFADYRTFILNFIRFTAWFIFLRRLYNRLPRLIY